MALPVSGPISLLDIQTEFGGTNPVSLSEYYKGGSYVSESAIAPNVPTSGEIKFSDFYGASQYVPQARTITLADGETFTVPDTIASTLFVTLIGAAGGRGGDDVQPGANGSPGRQVTGFLIVSPGDEIQASVGGAGVAGGTGANTGGGTGGYGGIFGFTGGRGGNSGSAGSSGGGGGGGGATAIKRNGVLVGVAAGGGGGGGGGWFSAGIPTPGYTSSGAITGGNGQDKNSSGTGSDGPGGGGGGGGQLGGIGGSCSGGDNGANSGSNGANLVPPAGSATVNFGSPNVIIQGTW